jgi:C1A family cysteine protease
LIHVPFSQAAAVSERSVDFSVQYFVNCVSEAYPARGNSGSRGCDGGSAYGAFVHSHRVGAVDSSCLPYTATTQNCTALTTCAQHLNRSVPHPSAVLPTRHFVAEYGAVGTPTNTSNNAPYTPTPPGNEAAMLKEIYARGPISCCMACPAEFEHGYRGGVFTTTSNRTTCDHIVAVVGFGGEGAGAYWRVQNSFGAEWGEGGYFRIKRMSALGADEHNLGVELACAWAMPAVPAAAVAAARLT